jgi:hypothetical protein
MKNVCPFCNTKLESSLVRHIKAKHGEEALRKAVLAGKPKRAGGPQNGNEDLPWMLVLFSAS